MKVAAARILITVLILAGFCIAGPEIAHRMKAGPREPGALSTRPSGAGAGPQNRSPRTSKENLQWAKGILAEKMVDGKTGLFVYVEGDDDTRFEQLHPSRKGDAYYIDVYGPRFAFIVYEGNNNSNIDDYGIARYEVVDNTLKDKNPIYLPPEQVDAFGFPGSIGNYYVYIPRINLPYGSFYGLHGGLRACSKSFQ